MTLLLRRLQYAIGNAAVRPWPYPHIFVQDVFPRSFYTRLAAALPSVSTQPLVDMKRVGKAYPRERSVKVLERSDFGVLAELFDALLAGLDFTETLLAGTFGPWLRKRFPDGRTPPVSAEVLLTRDDPSYRLGPHTDSPTKIATALFYFPTGGQQRDLGTSIYVPHDPTFRCPGTAHHDSRTFDRIYTAPFVPNSMFAFFKTDNSFHGVEPVLSAEPRRLLIFDVRVAGDGA